MEYQAKDFLKLRALILGNSVLNKLLIAHLSKQEASIFVGKSLTRLYGKQLRQIKERKGPYAKVPNFIMVDIFVSLTTNPATIMHSYKDFPPVFKNHNVKQEDSYINYLKKKIAVTICNLYSLNAAKADKIFSSLPKSLSILLEANKTSTNYWKVGFPKKLKEVSTDEISEEELETYHKALRDRLSAWRNLNLILIQLITKGSFKFDKAEKGKVIVTPATNNQVLLYYYSYPTGEFFSDFIEYENLSPDNCKCSNVFFDILGQK